MYANRPCSHVIKGLTATYQADPPSRDCLVSFWLFSLKGLSLYFTLTVLKECRVSFSDRPQMDCSRHINSSITILFRVFDGIRNFRFTKL